MVTTPADINNIDQECGPVKCCSPNALPIEIKLILDFLSTHPKITFKSQQRNDPELLSAEKLKMALEIYERNPQTFLLRFGNYLEEQHLNDFARFSIAKSDVEMHQMIEHYRTRLRNRKQDIKNRRFAALQKLIKDGEYFSEQEMMRRAPEMYQELVGQYLSGDEKKQRDSYDVRTTNFSGILMHTMAQQEMKHIMAGVEKRITQENNETMMLKENITTSEMRDENMLYTKKEMLIKNTEDDDIPTNYKHQWGNFDNEHIPCSTSYHAVRRESINGNSSKSLDDENLISAGERELLKQEFVGLMHEQFLAGQDTDFDYTTVDENTEYDDLQQIDRDKEEQYFNESDNEEDEDELESDCNSKIFGKSYDDKDVNTSESEDELDIYMRHLRNHLRQQ